MRFGTWWLVLVVLILVSAVQAQNAPRVKGVILQFNGKQVQGVDANTKDKAFKPVFEKELKKLQGEVKGKPKLTITHWYTVINGCAISWGTATDEQAKQVIDKLKKLPYVKTVERDEVVGIGR